MLQFLTFHVANRRKKSILKANDDIPFDCDDDDGDNNIDVQDHSNESESYDAHGNFPSTTASSGKIAIKFFSKINYHDNTFYLIFTLKCKFPFRHTHSQCQKWSKQNKCQSQDFEVW